MSGDVLLGAAGEKEFGRGAIPAVIAQHFELATSLFALRRTLVRAPHVKLHHIRRTDNRLSAQLDGLIIAGDGAWRCCEAALELPNAGVMFVATSQGIGAPDRLERLLALAEAASELCEGVCPAFAWKEADQLSGVIAPLLRSSNPFLQRIGVATCAMHRVDPGLVSSRLLDASHPTVRARAIRTAGELGKRELVSAVASGINDEDASCQVWAAWSAVLLGDSAGALEQLKAAAEEDTPLGPRAFQLSLLAMPVTDAHSVLGRLTKDPAKLRALIQGTSYAGDSVYIPWLISHMSDDKLARIAGESFSMITGLDLAWLDLERKPPEDFESGPNDDPNDPNVEMDPDDGLPWPDQERVQAWWDQNSAKFTTGVRHFMGATLSREHCIDVLKNGYQRQRIAAAYHLCLLNPGTPLFEWRAPAWRQQRELAQMS